jgi:Carboxypeptidase regulatory-like domain/TonB dependent receptor
MFFTGAMARAALGTVLLFPALAGGQVSRTTGSIQGSVVDQRGGAIAGATIRLVSTDTNQFRVVAASPTGTFLVAGLPVGTYQLTVESAGFATYQNNAIQISVGTVTSVPIRLGPATIQEQVTVSDEPPALDSTQTTLATTIDPERIEESPVVSRRYLDFVLLAPSLSQSNNNGYSASSSVLADSGFSFAGLRARSNSLYIDGVENNDEFDGSVRTELSPETIHEFQVINNGISAETGGGAGGSINVITKSGANVHHGDAFLFIQNGALDAREPLTNETTQPALDRQRAGFSLGGPIIRDRTFYYFAGEQERSHADDSSFISPSVASTINFLFSSGTYPRLYTRQLNAGTFRVERAETEASGRLDHQISDKHSFLLKYAFTNNREVGDAFNTSGLADPSSRGSSFTRDQGLTAGLNSVLNPSTVNNASFQISRRAQVLRTADQTGPGIKITGLVEFGRPYFGNGHRTEDHYEGLNATSIMLGPHLLKFGFDIDHIHDSVSAGDGFAGFYIFPSLSAFLAGIPDEFLQSWGSPRIQFAATKYAGFFQDHWTLSRRITLDAGLRYDFEQLPSTLHQETRNFAPRVGIAFSPSDEWVLRAGFGIFYDRYLLAAVNRSLEWNGATAFQQLAYGSLATQIFDTALGGAPVIPVSGIAPSVFTNAPNLATPYSEVANVGAQRLITRNLTVTATCLFAHGVKLPRTVNVNLPPPTILTLANSSALGFRTIQPQQLGRPVFGQDRLNPVFDNIYEWQNESSSTYRGVTFAMNRRLADEIEFSGSYTLSKTLDDASDFDEQPQNPYALRAERALSSNDQRHRFVFSGTFDLPFGETEGTKQPGTLGKLFRNIEAAPILIVGSGRPINPLNGFDANHNGAFPLSSRPLDFARNTLHTSTQVEVDLRLLKYFKIGEHGKLDFVAEAFNLLNHTNTIAVNQFFGPGSIPIPGFNTPDRAGIARQLQFSIDFEF